MTKVVKHTLLVVLSVLMAFGLKAQTASELRRQLDRLNKDIAATTSLLQTTQHDQSVNRRNLLLIQKTIDNRQSAITILNRQVDELSKRIEVKKREIAQAERQYNVLREQYSQMAVTAYKNLKTNSSLLFLFASDDFNDATVRLNYMRRVNAARKAKGAKLKELEQKLADENVVLSDQRLSLDSVLMNKTDEMEKLEQDRKRFNTAQTQLTQKERSLSAQKRRQQTEREAAEKRLAKLVNQGIAKESVKVMSDKERLEMEALSAQFDQNKGKLPMPVQNGVIVEHFGESRHKIFGDVKRNNTGVNIAARSGAEVLAAFDGTVVGVYKYQNDSYMLLRHGEYYTVYMNVETFFVKTGDKVKTLQKIGLMPKTDITDNLCLHFEVWHNKTRVDPEIWLY